LQKVIPQNALIVNIKKTAEGAITLTPGTGGRIFVAASRRNAPKTKGHYAGGNSFQPQPHYRL
jgi:hypothetical protein